MNLKYVIAAEILSDILNRSKVMLFGMRKVKMSQCLTSDILKASYFVKKPYGTLMKSGLLYEGSRAEPLPSTPCFSRVLN